MRNVAIGLAAGLLAASFLPAAAAGTLPYLFTVDSGHSSLAGTLAMGVGTSGTLIGNFDPASNPGGTRTKPGLFGPFGENENVPVPVTLAAGVAGNAGSATSGGFALDLDPGIGFLALSSLQMNLIHSGPIGADLTVDVQADTFRTRNPTSVYPGIPIQLPLGQATVTTLALAQIGSGAPGTLTETSPNHYQFSVVPLVGLLVTVDLLGTPLSLPEIPLPLPLTGEIVLAGQTALLTSVQPVSWSGTSNPQWTLPQFPLDLPTILPPGETAHLLFDLVVSEIGAELQGTLTTVANGTLVPEPGTLLTLGFCLLPLARRRR